MFNPVGSMAGIVLAQQLILSHLNPATAEERAAMDPAARDAIVNNELFWVCAPYVGLCAIAAAIWLFFAFTKDEQTSRTGALKRVFASVSFSVLPLTALYFIFPEMNKIAWILCGCIGPVLYLVFTAEYRSTLLSLLSVPRYWCGVIAQFFYVGVQIAAWTWLNVYCQKELGVSPADAAVYYTIAIVLFIVCRWVATFLMKYVNPAVMMAVFAAAALACSLGVVYLPTEIVFSVGKYPFSWNIVCLVCMSGFMSLMFPTIYGIALGGLEEKSLKLGAAGLIMSILGGAIITPWMAGIIGDAGSVFTRLVPSFSTEWDVNLRLSAATLRASFFVPAICFAVVGVYALVFRRPSR
jgi:FHS family L-fucose permease-like MFS transporter